MTQNQHKMTKRIISKSEIEILQRLSKDKVFLTKKYRLKLIERIKEIENSWYIIK